MRSQKEEKVRRYQLMEYRMAKIKITQIKSPIGRNKTQKKTLIVMGLNKINRSKVLDDKPSTLGMIEKVKHLLKIEQV